MCLYLFAPSRGQPLCFSLSINNSATLGKIKTFKFVILCRAAFIPVLGCVLDSPVLQLSQFYFRKYQVHFRKSQINLIFLNWIIENHNCISENVNCISENKQLTKQLTFSEIQLMFSEIELRFLKYICDFWNRIGVF